MRTRSLWMVLALSLAAATAAQAAPARYLLDARESRLTLEADTSLHRFSGEAAPKEGSFEADWEDDSWIRAGVVRVPVDALRTGNNARDHALQYTLDHEAHPYLILETTSVSRVSAESGMPRTYRVRGIVEAAGVKRPIEWTATAAEEGDHLSVQGELRLKVSEFKLRLPPLARFIRIKDDVTIKFRSVWRREALDV